MFKYIHYSLSLNSISNAWAKWSEGQSEQGEPMSWFSCSSAGGGIQAVTCRREASSMEQKTQSMVRWMKPPSFFRYLKVVQSGYYLFLFRISRLFYSSFSNLMSFMDQKSMKSFSITFLIESLSGTSLKSPAIITGLSGKYSQDCFLN